MIVCALLLRSGADGTVRGTARLVVFQLERFTNGEAVVSQRLPIHTSGGEPVVQGLLHERAGDGLRCQIARADQESAKLLAIFHTDEPPRLVANDGTSDGRGILLPVKGRR